MRRFNRGASVVLSLAGAVLVLLSTATLMDVSEGSYFHVERILTCRGLSDGVPVDPTDTFVEDEALIWVWFAGRTGARDTRVQMTCALVDSEQVGIEHEITIPRGTAGGGYCITMPTGERIPTGTYRITLHAGLAPPVSTEFLVESVSPTAVRGPRAGEHLVTAGGVSLSAPPDWTEASFKADGLALVHQSEPVAGVLVLPRTEDSASVAQDVVKRAIASLTLQQEYRVVKTDTLTVDGRLAGVLVLDLLDGSRQKLVVVGRDGAQSRVFYNLVLTAPRGRFSVVEPDFDRMVRTFRFVQPRP